MSATPSHSGQNHMDPAKTRLWVDLKKLATDPIPGICALPLEDNIFEWHFVIRGAPDTPYEGGIYHGQLFFEKDYPLSPPALYMLTPSGRFKTNDRLCLTVDGDPSKKTDDVGMDWNPYYTIGTLLVVLQSWMSSDERALGTIETPESERRSLARESGKFNLQNPFFCNMFPELAVEIYEQS